MNTTKIALEASLKELLKKKPFDKITIADLTEDCGISRMAFYYHFKDIYDLVEWACVEDGKQRQRLSLIVVIIETIIKDFEKPKVTILHDGYTAIVPYIFGNRKIKLVPIPSILST